MRIQTNHTPPRLAGRKPVASLSDDKAPQVTGQDMLLLNRIQSQERLMRASYALPWTGAAVGAAGVYYLAKTTVLNQFSAIGNHPGLWSSGLGLPVGLLLGAGLAEYLSTNAAVKIEEAEAQLSRK
ncbi:MAG: hypothetical protein KF760_15235 [Candidatus Eremiobacteraeota bacterium]|nr:hypothetical protein [Candidatus Eremiobacteraeota bacterium]MCW5866391.1 hypothetical protein [Candidatus Eremiobacteraeota bacterium]